MTYKNKYRIPMKNPGVAGVENSEGEFSVIIQERDYEGGETMLKGTVDGAVLRYLDNDERKYPAIQASELDIIFYSEDNFSLEKIITDDDLQYRVIVSHSPWNGTAFEDSPLWYGYLVTDDCTEQTEADPREIRLRATDGIGRLKTSALYEIDVYEKQTLQEIIQHCLSFTGHEIGLLVEVNVFEESMSDRDDAIIATPFTQCKVHTRSFLTDANTYTDCYEVLESIMTAFQCTIFQQGGRWIIQRKHDRWNQDMNHGTHYFIQYIWVGPVLVPTPMVLYETNNYKLDIDFVNRYTINRDQLKGYIGASKHTKITYRYETPPQMPRNSNFIQGDFLSLLSGSGAPGDPSTPSNTASTLKYWTFKRPNGTTVPRTPYLNVLNDYETGKEIERYIVLPRENPSADMEVNRIVSERVEVSKGDKVVISGEFRTKQGYNGSVTQSMMGVVLYGANGTNYTFHATLNNQAYPETYWRVGITQAIQLTKSSDENFGEWYNFNFTVTAFPQDGEIEFWLYNTTAYHNNNEAWFKNVSFDWQLFINDSVSIKGEYDKLAKNGTFRNTTERDIKIGDAPKKIISGALFRADDDTQLTAKWHRQGKNEVEKLIRINDICLHQSTHRLYSKIDGSFLGITYTKNNSTLLIGPANLFRFTVAPLQTKYYLPTNLEISLGSNVFRANFQEFYDTDKDNGDPQSDNKLFQYIYE